LIILHSNSNDLIGKILGSKLLKGLGLISYSAYLWHWPLFSFYRHNSLIFEPSLYSFPILICCTFGIAFFCWKYIEQPFRNERIITLKTFIKVLVWSVLCIFIFCIWEANSNHFYDYPGRVKFTLFKTKNNFNELKKEGVECLGRSISDSCKFNVKNSRGNIIMIGDSSLDSLSPEAQREFNKARFNFQTITIQGCYFSPKLKMSTSEPNRCNENKEGLLDFLIKQPPSIIIIGGLLQSYITGIYYAEGKEINGLFLIPIENNGLSILEKPNENEIFNRIEDGVKKLALAGHKVVIFLPTPDGLIDWPNKAYLLNGGKVPSNSILAKFMTMHYIRDAKAITFLESLTKFENVTVFDISAPLCPDIHGVKTCQAFNKDGGLLYSDNTHLSSIGSKIVIHNFIENMPGAFK